MVFINRRSGQAKICLAALMSLLGLFGLGLIGSDAQAQDEYVLSILDVEASPGDEVRIAVEGFSPEAAQGFSFAATYTSQRLQVDEVHLRETILEAIGTDYFEVHVASDPGEIIVGCLVDSAPPFDGSVIPSIGRPIDYFFIEARVMSDVVEDPEIVMVDGLSVPDGPPITNGYSIDNFLVPLDHLDTGRVLLARREIALFIRGDSTVDRVLDVSDAIHILNYRFLGGATPRCLDAADANDDQFVDISDAVYLLGFLFIGGQAPPAPLADPGPDPTVDGLGCEEPVDTIIVIE